MDANIDLRFGITPEAIEAAAKIISDRFEIGHSLASAIAEEILRASASATH